MFYIQEKIQSGVAGIVKITQVVVFVGKCIVIDSGHGGADPGKVGVAGTNEKEINLAIAKKLQERLEDAQINVIMTRDTDDDLSVESDKSKKKADLERRCDIINNDTFFRKINIHLNDFTITCII